MPWPERPTYLARDGDSLIVTTTHGSGTVKLPRNDPREIGRIRPG